MKWPRWIHRLYALLNGYFWLDCPKCGRKFGGHEKEGIGISDGHGGGHMTCENC